jgi:hypothetical protein
MWTNSWTMSWSWKKPGQKWKRTKLCSPRHPRQSRQSAMQISTICWASLAVRPQRCQERPRSMAAVPLLPLLHAAAWQPSSSCVERCRSAPLPLPSQQSPRRDGCSSTWAKGQPPPNVQHPPQSPYPSRPSLWPPQQHGRLQGVRIHLRPQPLQPSLRDRRQRRRPLRNLRVRHSPPSRRHSLQASRPCLRMHRSHRQQRRHPRPSPPTPRLRQSQQYRLHRLMPQAWKSQPLVLLRSLYSLPSPCQLQHLWSLYSLPSPCQLQHLGSLYSLPSPCQLQHLRPLPASGRVRHPSQLRRCRPHSDCRSRRRRRRHVPVSRRKQSGGQGMRSTARSGCWTVGWRR